MKTALVDLSDAEIKRQASNEDVGELRDPRHPGLRFRFLTDRTKGSWHVTQPKWKRVARYPTVNTKTMLSSLSKVAGRLMEDPSASAAVDTFTTLGQVLDWQLDRQLRNRALSDDRKKSLKSMIQRHLLPSVGALAVAEASKSELDRALFWKMQEEYSPSYVRQAYGVLRAALRQARRLELINRDPMDSAKFTDFVKDKILPKPTGLRPGQVPEVLELLAERMKTNPPEAMLALLMLAHGTRLGETRKARWKHVWFKEKVWLILGAEAKSRAEHQLPMTDQVAQLLTDYKAYQDARGGSAFLFPGRNGKCLSEKQASDVFVGLGKGEWTSHDLRKVARTSWTELGVDHLIGEMLLNHVMRGVTAAYIQTDAMPRKRAALELWHSHLDKHGFTSIHGKTEARSHVLRNPSDASSGGASRDISHAEPWSMQNGEKGSGQ